MMFFELAYLKKIISNSCFGCFKRLWVILNLQSTSLFTMLQVWSPADSQQDCHLDKDEVENKYALPFYIRSINLKPVFCTCVLNSLSKAQLKVYNLVEYISILALP